MKRFDGKFQDVFALQDQVTQKIVTSRAARLTPQEQKQVTQDETTDPQAYDAFLQGWAQLRRGGAEGGAAAIPYFERAVELDPEYGRAYAGLARTYLSTLFQGNRVFRLKLGVNQFEAIDRADEYLQAAKRDSTPLAHFVATQRLLFFSVDKYEEAIAEASRAVALDPNDPVASEAMATALIWGGRAEDAIQFVEKGMRLDPLSHNLLFLFGLAKFSSGQMQDAVTAFERALDRRPINTWNVPLAAAYAHLGKEQEARAALRNFGGGGGSVTSVMPFWPFKDHNTRERLGVGLVKAGLCCEDTLTGYLEEFRAAEAPD